jgi:hypothetical protein
LSLSVKQPHLKQAHIETSIRKDLLAITTRKVFDKFSLVHSSISIFQQPHLLDAIFPRPFKTCAIFPLTLPISTHLSLNPQSFILPTLIYTNKEPL